MKENKQLTGFLLVLYYMGLASILIGLMILSPLLVYIFYPKELSNTKYFLIPAFIALFLGLIIVLNLKKYPKGVLSKNHDALLTLLIWIYAILLSALPFYFSKNYTYLQGVFEATSGYTTTGLTVSNVETLPKVFLLYRSLLHLYGGVGIILLLSFFISAKSSFRLFQAEGHTDRLEPNIIKSARAILLIYLLYIVLGIIFYVIFGMSLFDAINHSISAVATGGFSTHKQSIGFYNSLPIEIITIVLMILGGTNFFVHLLIMKRKFKLAFNHAELKLLLLLTLLFVPSLVFSLVKYSNLDFPNSIRIAVFQYFSAATTTGLQTVPSFNTLPSSFIFHLIIIMIIGAGIGSTAGGMKLIRVSLALKSSMWDIQDLTGNKKMIRPKSITRFGEKQFVDSSDINRNYTFLFIYLLILFFGISILTYSGYSMNDSIFDFTSTLGTVGLSSGIIGSSTSNFVLLTFIVGMLFARLESFIIIIAVVEFFKIFKKRNKISG